MDGPKYYNIIENVQDKQNKNQDLRKIYVKQNHSTYSTTDFNIQYLFDYITISSQNIQHIYKNIYIVNTIHQRQRFSIKG